MLNQSSAKAQQPLATEYSQSNQLSFAVQGSFAKQGLQCKGCIQYACAGSVNASMAAMAWVDPFHSEQASSSATLCEVPLHPPLVLRHCMV